LAKLARALEISVDYLLGLSDDPAPRPVSNHPSLHDPGFAKLADDWPRIPRAVQENLLNVVGTYLDLLDKKARGEPLE